ncbi:MAG TPA: endolytic transglycosylase MltG [Methylomirabilota bacterium]|nr:endolytic transglycosylase MltG [Methylomirabilota bacterium]
MMERSRFLKTWAEPPRRPGFTLRAIFVLVLIVACLFVAVEGWLVMTAAPGVKTGPRVVEIPAHIGLLDVARLLDNAGAIRSPVGFSLLAILRGSARSLKAGEYQIPQGASTFTVLWLLEGGYVLKHTVVFTEGSTVAELARQLETERLARAEDVLRVARDGVFLRTIDIRSDSVEGYLFPDTYQFVKGMSPEEILARMVARMRERVSPELLEEARARDLSLHQVLTLASIIEKEAVDPSEMPLISAVFWNRLKREMPLQADPTVQYALGKDRMRLTREDLQVDSPFNTYRRPGLPPAPIASPGRLAIEAAVRPARVGYLYFVAMDERHHQFSSTLADHNAAVAKYRLARIR